MKIGLYISLLCILNDVIVHIYKTISNLLVYVTMVILILPNFYMQVYNIELCSLVVWLYNNNDISNCDTIKSSFTTLVCVHLWYGYITMTLVIQ